MGPDSFGRGPEPLSPRRTMRALVIGGGFSGLACACELASRGARVLLVEGRGRLGGRAYSYVDPKTGDVVDNGQHLFMGCFTETQRFLGQIGSLEKLSFQENLRVDFLGEGGELTSLRCPRLPSPWHLVAGAFRLKSLGLRDKARMWRLARGLAWGRDGAEPGSGGLTVEEWLTALGQTERAQRNFWNILATSALNEVPRVASARLLEAVLRQGFFGRREGSRIGLSRVGLSQLYAEDARRFIEGHQGEVRLGSWVKGFLFGGDRVEAVELAQGERLSADVFILAVDHYSLDSLLDEELLSKAPSLRPCRGMPSSPIISVNLWLDRPVTDRPFAALLGTEMQWLFNKSLLLQGYDRPGQYLALVMSGASAYVEKGKEELIEMALRDLHQVLPAARKAEVIHAVVVKEKHATFSPLLDVEGRRPGARTALGNLYLAGDWTDTGLPATIEGAVQSGRRAALLALGDTA